MNCPVCQTALIVVEHAGIEIDWCLDCRGLWFDEGELELLGEKSGRRLEAEEMGRRRGDVVERGDRKCPRCHKKMERLLLDLPGDATIEADRCSAHGFWLDRGELGGIIRSRELRAGSDEGLMLQFLGETFDVNAPIEENSR
jgi:Zn-finger nucleic acid-binding protein